MADRTERAQITVTRSVKEQWTDYKKRLQVEEGRAATDDEIIAAFIEGIPVWQADLMLRAYLRHAPATQMHDSGGEGE